MKKVAIVFMALLCLVVSLNAQQTSNIETYSTKDLGLYYAVNGDVLWSANISVVKSWNTKTLKLIKEIPLTDLSKEFIPIKLISFQNKILFFYKEFNKTEKKYQLSYKELLADGSSSDIKTKLVGNIYHYLNKPTSWEKRYTGYPKPATLISVEYYFRNLVFSKNSDGSRLYVSNAGINLFVFDENMEIESKKTPGSSSIKAENFATMGFGDYSTGISNSDNLVTVLGDKEVTASICTHVDIKGNSYELRKVYTNNKNEEITKSNKDRPNYNIELLTTEKGQKANKKKLNGFDKNFITNAKFFEDSNGKIWIVGLYNQYPDPGNSLGFFSTNIEQLTAKFYPYSSELIKQYLEKEKTKALDIDVNAFQVYDNGDGTILVVGQRSSYYLGNGSIYSGSLVSAIVDGQDNIQWHHALKKGAAFTGLDVGCGGYSYAKIKDKHYLIYLDNAKNTSSDLAESFAICKGCKNGYLRAFVIDKKGVIAKKNIFDIESVNKSLAGSFLTENIQQISEDEIIFEMLKSKKEAALVKLKID